MSHHHARRRNSHGNRIGNGTLGDNAHSYSNTIVVIVTVIVMATVLAFAIAIAIVLVVVSVILALVIAIVGVIVLAMVIVGVVAMPIANPSSSSQGRSGVRVIMPRGSKHVRNHPCPGRGCSHPVPKSQP